MEPLMYRLLISCLLVWLVEKTLGAFKVGEPATTIVMIAAVILAWLFTLFGWTLKIF